MTITRPALALMISLALNLILIGLFTGMMLSRSAPASSEAQPLPPRADASTRAERQAVRRLLEESRTQSEALRQAHQEARRNVHAVLTAPEFDPVAAEVAFAELREAELVMRTALQDDLLQRMPSLPVEQRRRLANRLLSVRDRRRARGQPRNRTPGN